MTVVVVSQAVIGGRPDDVIKSQHVTCETVVCSTPNPTQPSVGWRKTNFEYNLSVSRTDLRLPKGFLSSVNIYLMFYLNI